MISHPHRIDRQHIDLDFQVLRIANFWQRLPRGSCGGPFLKDSKHRGQGSVAHCLEFNLLE
jgi:hypothetical protein